MPMMLDGLINAAKKAGWAAGSGSMDQVNREVISLGLTEVPIRKGDTALSILRPTDRNAAHPNSLSARFGKGDQPLHTDGAHLAEPPDLLVLVCKGTSRTPTRIMRVGSDVPSCVRHGVFLVANGKDSFFTTAYYNSRLRFDPGCMTPCDARAREALRYFDSLYTSAREHRWDDPGIILVIDNRQTLHARPSAADDPDREIHRISFAFRREAL